MARLTPQQRAHLERKVNDLYGYTNREAARQKFRKPDTAAIAKQRATVKEFDAENTRRNQIVDAAFTNAANEAKEAIMFLDATEALAYVKALKPAKVG